jgi:hypothetical protein
LVFKNRTVAVVERLGRGVRKLFGRVGWALGGSYRSNSVKGTKDWLEDCGQVLSGLRAVDEFLKWA